MIKKKDTHLDMAVALGDDTGSDNVEIEAAPRTVEERVLYLEQISKQHTISLDSLFTIIKNLQNTPGNKQVAAEIDQQIDAHKSDNKIPVGTQLVGITKGIPYYCSVGQDGFWVGISKYNTLSAAAEGVSGVRRSGWAFWRFSTGQYEGKTVREIYKGN